MLTLAGCADTESSGGPRGSSPTITGTPEPFPCTVFRDTYWDEFEFGIDSPAVVIAKVARLWAIDDDRIQELEPAPEEYRPYRQVVWESLNGRVEFVASFWQEETLLFVTVILSSRLSLGQVLECLGQPEYYSAYSIPDVDDAELRLDLWFVEKGIVMSHSSWLSQHRQELPPVPLSLVMNSIEIVAHGDPAQMVSAAYDWSNPGEPEYAMCILRPWPGSIEAVEVEGTYPELSQCYEPR